MLKIGPRQGDGAPMAFVELVQGAPVSSGAQPEAEGRRRLRRPGRRRGATSAGQASVAAESPETESGAEESVSDGDEEASQ
jgi:hypothetical protein